MQLDWMRAKGIGPFREEFQIDFTALPMLVAITGANGAGKSTFLELFPAAMYRKCPTRGSLVSLATDRDSFVEVGATNGASWRLRQTVDSVSGKGESIVLDQHGQPQLTKGQTREFAAWAAKHLPAPSLLFASNFASQGSGGFLDLDPSDRKAVVLRALEIEHIEKLAKCASDHARESEVKLRELDAALSQERSRGGDVGTLSAEVDRLRKVVEDARADVEKRRVQLEALRVDHAAWREEAARARALEADLNGLRKTQADLEERIANNRAILVEEPAIREAQAKASAIDEEASVVRARADRLGEELSAAEASLEKLQAEWRAVDDRIHAKEAVIESLGLRLGGYEAAKEAGARVIGLEENVRSRRDELNYRRSQLEIARTETQAASEGRIEALLDGLRKIQNAADLETAHNDAEEAIHFDAEALAKIDGLPDVVTSAQFTIKEEEEALKTNEALLVSAQKLAGSLAMLDRMGKEREDARAEIVTLVERRTVLSVEIKPILKAATSLRDRLETDRGTLRAIELQRKKLAPMLQKVEGLAQAETRIAERQAQLVDVNGKIDAVMSQFEAIVDRAEPANPAKAESDLRMVEAELRSNESGLAVVLSKYENAVESAKRVAEMIDERNKLDADHADWVRLAKDLGRDGIQALEIDAAGPELTELVNDLLRRCVSTRWTVSIEASRTSADGKKTLEGCEVRVIDSIAGREGTAESLSGGERVLISEAISLALSMLSCRRNGVQGVTLVRDESGAALDPANGRAYVAMLRRAAELIGASRVLFVSHNPELAAMADARIQISDGTVQVAA